MESSDYEAAIGRTEIRNDTITPGPAQALAATLDLDPGQFTRQAELPPLWLWLYFLPVSRASETGPDGHPKRGGFLPPVILPRRMWAGSRIRFGGPVHIGDDLSKRSTVASVKVKSGRSGEMVFVTVRHEWSHDGQQVMEEEQDIVYMAIPDKFSPPEPVPVPECPWMDPVKIDPVMLFRFSAVTFNGHRIHYDRTYAMEVEHYPGLVVHGPLQAVLLMEAARRWQPGRRPDNFRFRALRPLFDFDAVSVCGRMDESGHLELWTQNGERAAGMQAHLGWAAD